MTSSASNDVIVNTNLFLRCMRRWDLTIYRFNHSYVINMAILADVILQMSGRLLSDAKRAALYNIGSGSWSAWDRPNGIAEQYAASMPTLSLMDNWTCGALANIPPPNQPQFLFDRRDVCSHHPVFYAYKMVFFSYNFGYRDYVQL